MRLPRFLVLFPSFWLISPSFWGIFCLFQPGSASFRVVGPGRPIAAAVGDTALLPCHLSPPRDARGLDVRWIRHRFSDTVHHYRAGQERRDQQLPEYAGRTELVRDGLAGGAVDLRIARLRPSDDGQYVCTVSDRDDYQEATVELEVAAVGSVPHLSLDSYAGGGIRVLCRSTGWFPPPDLLWGDPGGRPLPPTSPHRSPDPSGLFAIEDAMLVTRNNNGTGTWSCAVRNGRSPQEQRASLHVSAPFFDDARPFMAALGVFVALALVLMGLSAYLYSTKLTQTRQLGQQTEELVWRKFLLPQNPDAVTLDTDTAHANLVLSNDLRSVRWARSKLGLPETARRFKSRCCVLGRHGFQGGRHCWGVTIEGQRGGDAWWALGVAKESVERGGLGELSSERGVWGIQHRNGQLVALTSPRTPLSMSPVPSSVWVLLERDGGCVAFVDGASGAEFYRFSAVWFGGEKIHPWLRVETGNTRLSLRDGAPAPPAQDPGPMGSVGHKMAADGAMDPLLGGKGDQSTPSAHGVQTGGASTHGVQTGDPNTHGVQTGGPNTHGMETGGPSAHGVQTGGPNTHGVQTGDPNTHGVQTGGPSDPGV